jgi:hypothetical protein
MLKFKNSMKKILYLLITAQMFSCDFSGKQTNSFNSTGGGGTTPFVTNPTYMNTAFGYSVPIMPNLKKVVNQQTQSICFVDAQTESTTDLLMIIPFTESLDEIAQQLTGAGTPYQKADGNIIVSVQQPGVTSTAVYAASPHGEGGIGAMRIITGQTTFAESTITKLLNGILFYKPQASFEERNQLLAVDIQRQKDSNEQHTIESLRRERAYEHGMHELNSIGDN